MTDNVTVTTDATKTVATAPAASFEKPAKGELTPEYVAELRRENKERRAESETLSRNLEETAKKLQETESNAKKALEEVQALNHQAEQKMIRADLKVFANKHGLRDIEDVKLADFSAIKVDKNGDVAGVEEALIALKEKKPYLFGEVTTSRSIGSAEPAPQSKYSSDEVAKMSKAEYAAYEADFLNDVASGKFQH
jgi:hypothetical protein